MDDGAEVRALESDYEKIKTEARDYRINSLSEFIELRLTIFLFNEIHFIVNFLCSFRNSSKIYKFCCRALIGAAVESQNRHTRMIFHF